MTDTAVNDFVIAGGGTAGWMTAAALSRFAPPGTSVTLVESEAIGTVGVGEATIPQIHLFNSALGLDEAEFLRETRGSFKLGIEFDGWRREGESYMHAFGDVGRPLGLLPFQHYWLRAQHAGFAKPLQRYSLNELAARTMRMYRGKTAAGREMPYAYHFDAGLYAAYLRRFAEARGVTRVEGRIAKVARHGESGDIAALELEGGERVEGSFFIDCTGFRALLIEGALGAGFDDWSNFLPCDRAMAVPCEGGGDFTPYTRAIARKAGWQWRIPLQHRIGNGLVYCSDFLSDDEAAETLLANLDGAPQAEPRPIRFTTGKRCVHWKNNCLAIGLAAGFMEPMESTSIHMIQSAISRFLAVLPRGRGEPATVDWFNAQSSFEWECIRDFLVLHYTANEREGRPFWDHVRSMELPATLTARMEQWRAGGFIHREHEELFTEIAWFQVFAGQGVEARGYNPMADTLPEAELRALLDETEASLVEQVKPMPRHLDFLQGFVTGKTNEKVTA
ncbi:tryptophan halogenase family protein [Alteraurantiacibacter aquimixticola]|uniref:Tryptophan 7-halogenase n=1 Tax=Alteraurantiacibacter aquimixticola TaxID=2489173 RepID=A0A4V4U8X8_9SPHN|nr:tryptophan halogenase family protein [Alteraurantiacibacter aquimixticola]TIX51727.1 tryptophan 7-halogenase [Alteraurantiacibacter aquimixticola]